MEELGPGLYETLVTEQLRAQLEGLSPQLESRQRTLEPADAPDRIAWYVANQVRLALKDLSDTERVRQGVQVARAVLDQLASLAGVDPAEAPVDPASVLYAISRRLPDGRTAEIAAALTPLLDTTLLTNAPGEPVLQRQLESEIESAERIDLVMSFIRRTGVLHFLPALQRHCEAGRALRVLTTTYMNVTERRALDELAGLGAQIRISYDTSTTRLHAKAWVFHRGSGFSTAYVGSSNLSRTAQVTGLEWNVRVSQARNPALVDKFHAVFTSYWERGDFVPYRPEEFDEQQRRAGVDGTGAAVLLSPIELRPEPFQQRLLELIEVSRREGHHRNLLVAATGTGKTVMAALDYAALRQRLPRSRLLFVAHRAEILDQSRDTFRYALREPAFGERWVGGSHPRRFDHVFASVQSLNTRDLGDLDPDHFDVVVIDEFHHAAAPSYRRILQHLRPAELLGLTATPERSDGLPVLGWFGNRIAAELRLWDAIDQQHLSPFVYFGIHDGLNLQDVPWKRGQGYDIEALSGLYTSSDAWARLVVKEVDARADVATMRCLGFCVSVEHARFMARHFREHNIPAVAIWGDSADEVRGDALRDLAIGRLRAVFSVDLFNEGIDIPAVDTVLLLRPTESPTLFLQQLGRGLRKATGKAVCTVLDFVGNHRREFRFDRRLRALLGGSRRDVEQAVRQGFPFLPAGCSMRLDEVATEIVLRSLRDALPTKWPAKVEELRSLLASSPELGLEGFLTESGLDLDDVYDGGHCWSDLQVAAGKAVLPAGPAEGVLRRALSRLLHIDDRQRVDHYRAWLDKASPPVVEALPLRERRLLHMLVAQLLDQAVSKEVSVQDGVDLLWSHPQVRQELGELFSLLRGRIDHLHTALDQPEDSPLQVHARYSRLEILAAMGLGSAAKIPSWQSGVYEARAAKTDLLAFTLDKSSGRFSPTTRYQDYAVTPTLIYWESQSSTRADSAIGMRYRHHAERGWTILLFTRLRTDDRAFWFLGPATYRGHTGEKPMAVTWELTHPLPGDLFAAFAAAVA